MAQGRIANPRSRSGSPKTRKVLAHDLRAGTQRTQLAVCYFMRLWDHAAVGPLIESLRELPSQLFAILVARVVQLADHGHRAGQSPPDRLRGLLAQELRLLQPWRACVPHSVRGWSVLRLSKPTPSRCSTKRGDEMLPRLLAAAHDFDAGLQLLVLAKAQLVPLALG